MDPRSGPGLTGRALRFERGRSGCGGGDLFGGGAAFGPSAPDGRALFEEGGDAFVGVLVHHVLRHDFAGEGIGLGAGAFALGVEEGLAPADGVGALGEDRGGEVVDGGVQRFGSGHGVDEAPVGCGAGADELAGYQHLDRKSVV